MTELDKGSLFKSMIDEASALRAEFDALAPKLAQARRDFFKSRSDATEAAVRGLEQRAGEVHQQLIDLGDRMQAASGLSDEDLEALKHSEEQDGQSTGDRRSALAADRVRSGADIGDVLRASLERLLAAVGTKRLEQYAALPMPQLFGRPAEEPLSLVRGVRPESEYSATHRFAQSIRAAGQWLAEDSAYDHFGGAMLLPQVAMLADQLDVIQHIPGASKRVKSLWHGPSEEVDSTIFELLVGAGCVRKGRDVRFLETGTGKTPDLMCETPYPLAIECKRKRPLSAYETEEEKVMRALFLRLESAARSAGMWGSFVLELNVEASASIVEEVVTTLIRLRFAGGDGARMEYPWGTVSYTECVPKVVFPSVTRLYSPHMLDEVFDWSTDLPQYDGLICRVSNDKSPLVSDARHPIGLLWSNHSEQAVKKRSWGPGSVVTDALKQIPSGDFGIIYVAYQEGAREQMADGRTDGFMDWMQEISHRNDIRVPLCRLIRLYPRALEHGQPDLIESNMPFVSNYGDEVLPRMFPATVFTKG